MLVPDFYKTYITWWLTNLINFPVTLSNTYILPVLPPIQIQCDETAAQVNWKQKRNLFIILKETSFANFTFSFFNSTQILLKNLNMYSSFTSRNPLKSTKKRYYISQNKKFLENQNFFFQNDPLHSCLT